VILLIAFATFASTLVGGLVALKLKDQLHLILGFSAGAVLGVAFFDLLPEALELGERYFDHATMTAYVGLGFLAYLLLDRLVFLHAQHAHGGSATEPEQLQLRRGILGAGSLSLHSFLDGVAIGLAFQVSTAIGVVVAVAVLVHDFSDGINTVGFILKHHGKEKDAFRWLIVDAVAPVVGAGSTLLFHLPEASLSVVLAIFCGFFLYIGASDLIPESQHAHPKSLTTLMTLLGAGVLYAAVRLANF
jgi:ZIP family zinc transporter